MSSSSFLLNPSTPLTTPHSAHTHRVVRLWYCILFKSQHLFSILLVTGISVVSSSVLLQTVASADRWAHRCCVCACERNCWVTQCVPVQLQWNAANNSLPLPSAVRELPVGPILINIWYFPSFSLSPYWWAWGRRITLGFKLHSSDGSYNQAPFHSLFGFLLS